MTTFLYRHSTLQLGTFNEMLSARFELHSYSSSMEILATVFERQVTHLEQKIHTFNFLLYIMLQ